MSKKKETLLRLYRECRKTGEYTIDNEKVKEVCKETGFGNPFDITKIDRTDILPEEMQKDDYCLMHLGGGKHQFVRGIAAAYHDFEEISADDRKDWSYKKSILNEIDSGESSILSTGFNQKVVHDFLYDDITASPKVYNSKRTKASFKYKLGDTQIELSKIQIEIDMTVERGGLITVFEGKNGFPQNFSVYQLYHPYLYYKEVLREKQKEIKGIQCCYLLRKQMTDAVLLRMYLYAFDDDADIGSVCLKKAREYRLTEKKA